MPYWQTFYHITWATKHREPLITPDVEAVIHGFIRSKAIGLKGIVFALNGTTDHVHLVTSIPPSIAVSTYVGQVKGVSSARFNKMGLRKIPLFWQDDFGVFTFDHKRLPNVVLYVENQKTHHSQSSVIPVLERTDDQGVRLVHEPSASYLVNDEQWREEMTELD